MNNTLSIHPARLRCEYLENPLGIDVRIPRLSWIVQSSRRGQKQTAYRVLVASSPEILARDEGDVWDSGKVDLDQTLHIEYAGKELTSGTQCFWKVCAWDVDGTLSLWSESALWTMGLLKAEDWQDAKWIAYDDPDHEEPPPRRYGFQTWLCDSPDTEQWVAIDLGERRCVDEVKLFPAGCCANDLEKSLVPCYGWQPDFPGVLFPVRFTIEVANNADFSNAITVVDRTEADVPNPGASPVSCRFEPVAARYVRLRVTRLFDRLEGNYGFALAEMWVLCEGINFAEGKPVTAPDSVETGGWSKDYLVDGQTTFMKTPRHMSGPPATMLRKEFRISKAIKRATAYVTGLGLYELRINGQRVSDHLLAPEWTRYDTRILYQTYDVTELLRAGSNALGAQLHGGWWASPMAVNTSVRDPQFCLLLRLDIELDDGSTQSIVTDSSWQASIDGPIRGAGIYFGEIYDGTKQMPGWDQSDFDAKGWSPVKVLPCPDASESASLSAQSNEPIRVVKELTPVEITEPKPGLYVFDMGQNMVGWCRIQVDAPAGTKITLRHAEVRNDDGTLYTDNLRGADQVNEYTWPGGEAQLEPHFTYHGFRYVEVTGLPTKPDKNTLTGRVFHSSAPDTGRFECSNDLINKIMRCVQWVQRGNLHSAPTDCPQRSERFGFTGDIQAFSQTAMFNMNLAGFFTKWLRDIRDSQLENGRLPNVAPHPGERECMDWCNVEYAPAWSDAGVLIPWRMYERYGDVRILQDSFASARRWVEFIRERNPDFIWRKQRGGDYGDWLNGDMTNLDGYPKGISTVPRDLFATAFYYRSVETLARIAAVLGRKDQADEYTQLAGEIKSAFQREFVSSDGSVKGDTQGGYAIALAFDLLEVSIRPKAVEYLIGAINTYKGHLSTGIHLTHYLMLELTRNHRHDEACRLINLRTVPSWGYMVDQGATTIWERWDGIVAGRGMQSANMNSFNHWALGSVGEWVWRELAGIHSDECAPGYKHVFIRPNPCKDLSWVNARYDSIRGPITSEWCDQDGQFDLTLDIPANTTATVYVPTHSEKAVSADGGTFVRMEEGRAVYAVQSGRYRFQVKRIGDV